MKKTLFIIIGGSTLFLIFSLWLYLLLFGTPESVDEVVGDFGFADITTTPISVSDDLAPGESRQLDLDSGTLYQLTTKPVAGFDFIYSGTSSLEILYAERGTGHVYLIDTNTGLETRLLQKTFIAINRAFFAEDGSAAILIGESQAGSVAYLEELDPNRTPHQFPGNAENITFFQAREVRYTISNQNGTAGYSYDLDTAETDQLFGIPLKDVVVIWGDDETLVYNRMAPTLAGSLYSVTGSTLVRAGASGIAYSAFVNPRAAHMRIETFAHPQSGNLVSKVGDLSLGISSLSEKCTFDAQSIMILWCASPVGLITPQAQSEWYKGKLSFSDFLWKIDLQTGTAVETDNLKKTTSRDIDVIDILTNESGSHLLFKNKNDDTLWLKRLLDPTTNEEFLSDSEEVTDGEI